MFNPRPKQQKVIDFTQGKMGVAAVPGSGKTQTLSFLAAKLIHDGFIEEGQEILVVTMTNSAVGNFQSRIDGFIHGFGMIKGIGYRVRTLHGLAHDIVRERPDLVGLPTQFNIIDEREASLMLESSVRDWLIANPEVEDRYFLPDMRMNNQKKWIDTIIGCCVAFIRTAKDQQIKAEDLSAKLSALDVEPLLLRMGCDVYADYTRKLSLREGVDFDDLIRYALYALQTDPEFLKRLRVRWPYILEDEAQDSSRLQQDILELLSAEGGNWVRVGDPNQAIFETFTTADPRLLTEFIERKDVEEAPLTNAGRSSKKIIDLANHLVDWTKAHPMEDLRDALYPAHIEETPPGDPQPNPPDEDSDIHIFPPIKKLNSEQEIRAVLVNLRKWFTSDNHQNETAAILVPTNYLGEKVIAALKEAQMPYVELLRNTADTRRTAQQLEAILRALSRPTDNRLLQKAYDAIRQPKEIPEDDLRVIAEQTSRKLSSCKFVENYLYPQPGGKDWLEEQSNSIEPPIIEELVWLRTMFTRWQAAVMLPVDQLILTIAADLYQAPPDLALSQKFAQMLEFYSRSHRSWSLEEFATELNDIAASRRGFSGMSMEDTGFDPDDYRGQVTVATMHKSKGLEWDIVFLLSVSNYDFPSLDPFDNYFAEKYFVRDNLNLQEETMSQLDALIAGDMETLYQPDGYATKAARESICEEKLRVLYVGITRARKELFLLYNTGTRKENRPARAYSELYAWWKEIKDAEVEDAAST